MGQKISFTSSDTKIASEALDRLSKLYGNCAIEDADVIVALGGDGFMLQKCVFFMFSGLDFWR